MRIDGAAGIPDTKPVSDGKARGAAKDFEALLIAQMLKSTHHPGTDADQSGQAAMDFAEEHFASVISAGGGLGLAKVIEQGLSPQKLHD